MTAGDRRTGLTDRRRRAIGRVMNVTAAALSIAAVIISLASDPASIYRDWIVHNSVGGLVLAGLGWFLVEARPRNRAAWLFPWMALFQALNAFGIGLLHGLDLPTVPEGVPVDSVGALGWIGLVLAQSAWAPGIVPMVTLALLWFPDGRLPSSRWRPVEWLAGVTTAGATLALAWSVRPVDGVVDAGADSVFLGLCVAGITLSIVLSLAGSIVRYRRTRGTERRRFRWVAWSTGTTAVAWLAANLIDLVATGTAGGAVFQLVSLGTLGVFFGGYAMAIWRHQLFDIDVVISRTLLFGSLAGFIGAVYVAVVVGIGSLVGQTSGDSQVLSLVATVLIAFLFQPVRRRLEHGANLLVYGRRATPYEVLADMSGRLARAESTDGLIGRMVSLLGAGTAAERVVVWRPDEAGGAPSNGEQGGTVALAPLAVWPPGAAFGARPDPGDHTVAIERAGQRLGALSVTKRRGEELTPTERRLLDDLAASAGLVLDRARLDAALVAQADALVRSRRRLLDAQTDERRRLQRQLGDGTHRHLHALATGLDGGAGTAFDEGLDPVGRQLEALAAEIRTAGDEIDALARGMYPPVLEADGVTAAVESLATGLPVPVTIDSAISTRIDLDVEQAVYFTVAEALTNVVKHAEATTARVRIDRTADELRFDVIDDGRGFDPGSPLGDGTGLDGLRDRIETVGGTLTVDSTPGRGTVVSGRVTLAPVAPVATVMAGG